MTNDYIYVTGQDGEIYEVRPTDALLDFLQRLAEREEEASRRETDEPTLLCIEGARS
jgi:hypothetical protein